MEGHRRITVKVDRRDLESAQAFTGKGISETLRIALRLHVQELIRQRGTEPVSRPEDRSRTR